MPKHLSDEQVADKISALLEEKRSCKVRGLGDREKAVDAELKRLGADPSPPAKRAKKLTPKKRTQL